MANIQFVKRHLVMDEFSYTNCEGQNESIYFPSTMAMSLKDVENYLIVENYIIRK